MDDFISPWHWSRPLGALDRLAGGAGKFNLDPGMDSFLQAPSYAEEFQVMQKMSGEVAE